MSAVTGHIDDPRDLLGDPLPIRADLVEVVATLVEQRAGELTYMRRWLHARPERSRSEHETTAALRERLIVEGLDPHVLRTGTGLVCDVGEEGPLVALRADIDGLAMHDAKDVPYRSMNDGTCHACGHDVHTSAVLGAGLVLRDLIAAGRVAGRVRLVFEPAEEAMPGGALDVIADGWLEEVSGIFGVHCDPKLDAGRMGFRVGAITSASDAVHLQLQGPGGHTARPELTVNLTDEAARVVRELPCAVQSAIGERGEARLVFGMLASGSAPNVIPSEARMSGSLRTPSSEVWEALGTVLPHAIARVLDTDLRPEPDGHRGSRHDGLHWHLVHRQGVPPVLNDPRATQVMARAAAALEGVEALSGTPHSWGGDTFGWYLHQVPGCYARLGTHWPGRPQQLDLHRPTFDVDERAIPLAARVLALTAAAWLADLG